MNTKNPTRDQSMLWGYSIEFLDRVGIVSMIVGAGLGVCGLIVSLVSAYLLYRVADVAQKDLANESRVSAERVAGLNNETARLQAENLALQTVLLPRHVGIFTGSDGIAKADIWFAPMAEFDSVKFAVQPVSDPEARNLAEEIALALAFVGISASIDEGMTTRNPTTAAEGVSVWFPSGNPLLERAGNALADALTNAGLGIGDWPVFRRGGIPAYPEDTTSIHLGVVVEVGQRPVSHMVAWLNRERSKAAGNASAPKTDTK
jgi:hypothetical protein